MRWGENQPNYFWCPKGWAELDIPVLLGLSFSLNAAKTDIHWSHHSKLDDDLYQHHIRPNIQPATCIAEWLVCQRESFYDIIKAFQLVSF